MRAKALLVLAVLLLAQPANAARLRVLAATEMRIEPRVSPDRTALGLTVRIRDDQGTASRGPVQLAWWPEGGAERFSETGRTDARGEASFSIPVRAADRVFVVEARYGGTESAAPAFEQVRVDLDAPFLTLDLRGPAVVDRGEGEAEFIASIQVGEVVLQSPEGLVVQLVADDQPLGSTRADGTGRALFRVPIGQLGAPGVRSMRAEHVRAGATVSSPTRRLVLRARTLLTLERSRLAEQATTLVGVLATAAGPVPRAAIRLLADGQVVGAGLTDVGGVYSIALDPEVAARPGLEVRATFAPSEPWFLPSESASLRLTPPAAIPVRWTLVSLPVLGALALLLLLRLARRRTPAPAEVPPRVLDDARLEHVAETPAGTVRVRLLVIDRATQAPVPDAQASWSAPAAGTRGADESVELPGAGRFEVHIVARGYAPRALSGELPRGGEYALRVPLRGWREELFERLRRWMLRAGAQGTPAMPTPRELLAGRAMARPAEEFVQFVEQGVYGPQPPDAETVEQADALAASAGAPRHAGSVDAKN